MQHLIVITSIALLKTFFWVAESFTRKSKYWPCILLLLPFCLSVFGQAPSKQWDKSIGGTSYDWLSTQIQTSDGGYLLGGSSFSPPGEDKSESSRGHIDIWIVKLDTNGNKQWDKTFGGTSSDHLSSIIQTSDGGYLLGGQSRSDIGGDKTQTGRGETDFWVIKISSTGIKQWDRTFGGDYDEALSALLQTEDGGYLLAGHSSSDTTDDKSQANKGGYDIWIIKLTSTGVKLWDKAFGGSHNDYLLSFIKTSDGGFLLGGTSSSPQSGDKSTPNLGGRDYWLIKIDASWVKQWDKAFGGSGEDSFTKLSPTADGGFLLGGTSSSPQSGNKSAPNLGGNDYWLIKIDATGVKQWDKTIGASGDDQLRTLVATTHGNFLLGGSAGGSYNITEISKEANTLWSKTFDGPDTDNLTSVIQTGDNGFLVGGYSYSGIGGDKTQPNKGDTDFWIIKTQPPSIPPCSAAGTISREVWANISGKTVAAIPADTPPTSSSTLSSFEAPSNIGNNYGQRIRGYLCAPASGNYTFYIASDDHSELWFSTDEDPAKKVKIAFVSGWTESRQWTKFASQKSVAMALVAGKKYYIEALHKDDTAGDRLAVGWTVPTSTSIEVIAGALLSPYRSLPVLTGKISREVWSNVSGSLVSEIPLTTAATSVSELTSFEAPANEANNYGQRIRGYVHPTVSGSYTFYLAGDDKCELWLSTEETQAKKVKIAWVNYFAGVREWTKYSSQKSTSIPLLAGKKYYIEALHKEGWYSDHLVVGWSQPGQATICVISGSYLSPFLSSAATARMGTEESPDKQVKLYPNPFEDKLTLNSSHQGKLYISISDNLGRVVFQAITQAATELDLSHLKKGVYIAKLSLEDGTTNVSKIIKR